MRIPLDYYRILGLPIQATAEQLQQAHRDRSVQLPRREYSEVAIVARKQLVDEAYSVLSDPEQHQAYDAGFLSKTYELNSVIANSARPSENANGPSAAVSENGYHSGSDTHTPTIDIEDKQLVGALLILQELGEYELVLKLSQPYLSNGRFKLKLGQLGEPQLVGPDIILTVALALLELGREQWHGGQYENAAASLETGQDLLLSEGLFPILRGEMQADLYKLRPYRILELLEESGSQPTERRKGLQLLQDMLTERGGIDGSGDDQSGLSVDDFLRFIQQLRSLLTVEEQQNLFEAEARRPSAVGTYLAVYALIARGFFERQPALIRQAKLMLQRLGKRQDVNLEKAICAMLLGQTTEASQSLELSQEYETLDFIRQNSLSSPDLLPGLCLYGERWLQDEVFPHFRDLAGTEVSLKDYFADVGVQAYLETLPTQEEEAAFEWFPVQSVLTPVPKVLEARAVPTVEPEVAVASRSVSPSLRASSSDGVSALPDSSMNLATEPDNEQSASRSQRTPSPSLALPPTMAVSTTNLGTAPPAQRVTPTASRSSSSAERRNSRIRSGGTTERPAPEAGRQNRRSWQRSTTTLLQSLKMDRLVLLGLAAVVGLGLLWFLTSATWGLLAGLLRGGSGPTLAKDQPAVRLDGPPVPIPKLEADLLAAEGPLTEPVAQRAVETWFSVKRDALGPNHAVGRLGEILTGPALAKWQQWANEAKQSNSYQKYKHSLSVKSVDPSKDDPNRAKAEASVSEAVEIFEGGKLADQRDDNMVVRYDLVRKDGRWRIQDWEVVR
ncbi:IMS domain-containing protein [Ancylothrix sp. C2]|uniref:IMS domain-containing protein n=1 Tax=Ancylothrix sp. D3o TaxID=2953691 RepID=UPI0021BA7853|nr:IMS domain-containing protein [Ancylothrix sp. D3o]MCT7948752.1 IMS domain-containing protein [Ancylothrix sp. D3o]